MPSTYQGRERTLFIPMSPGRTITVTATEDPRIAILRTHLADWCADDAVEILAEIDAVPKPLEPLTPHMEHAVDERCPECVPQSAS